MSATWSADQKDKETTMNRMLNKLQKIKRDEYVFITSKLEPEATDNLRAIWFNPDKKAVQQVFLDETKKITAESPSVRKVLFNTNIIPSTLASWNLPSNYNSFMAVGAIRSIGAGNSVVVGFTSTNAGYSAAITSANFINTGGSVVTRTSVSFTIPAANRPFICYFEILFGNASDCLNQNGYIRGEASSIMLPGAVNEALVKEVFSGDYTTTSGSLTQLQMTTTNLVGNIILYGCQF